MVACPWPDAPHEAYPGVVVVPESDEEAGFISGEAYEASPDILVRLDVFDPQDKVYTWLNTRG